MSEDNQQPLKSTLYREYANSLALQPKKPQPEPNPYRRTLEKPQLTATNSQSKKERVIGRIVRNNSSHAVPERPRQQSNDNEYFSRREGARKYNDEFLSKTRGSQLGGNYERPLLAVADMNIAAKLGKDGVLERPRGGWTAYETQYSSKMGEYEQRKKKVEEEIKNMKKMTIETETPSQNQPHLSETPKFASALYKSNRSVRSSKEQRGGKASRSKWQEFILNIKEQITLFEKLRSLKHQVGADLKEKTLQLLKSKHQISEDIVSIDPEEFDPFFTRTDCLSAQSLADQVAAASAAAERHWAEKMAHRFDEGVLNEIFSALEGEKERESVSLQGLVRELGVVLQNEKYLRNRDVWGIYRKLQPFTREKFVRELGRTRDYSFRT